MIRVHPKGLIALAIVIALFALATDARVIGVVALAAGLLIDTAILIVPFLRGARSHRSRS